MKKEKLLKKSIKVWKSRTADVKFSEYIRKRDGKCLKCGRKERLQCSHFWSRNNSSVRYDQDNCTTLCYPCHYGDKVHGWEFNKQGEYRYFMIRWLGEKKYNELEIKSGLVVSRRYAIIQLMNFLSSVL